MKRVQQVIFLIDLEYPNQLHRLHNDYPSAPEKLSVSYDTLSNYQKTITEKYEIQVGTVKKLVPDLVHKTN